MIDKVDVSRQAKKTSLYLQKFDCPMNSDLIVTFSADIQKQFTALWFWMTNADNVDEKFDGVKNDNGTWTVKVPASHFEHYGFVKQSVRVWVTIDGSDYCIAFADADILPDNPCAIIGQGTWRELKLKVDELEADIQANYYTKSEVDDALNEKANASDVPTKTSDLINDSGFLTENDITDKRDKTDLTVYPIPPEWELQSVPDGITFAETPTWIKDIDKYNWHFTTSDSCGWVVSFPDEGKIKYPTNEWVFAGSWTGIEPTYNPVTVHNEQDMIAKKSELPQEKITVSWCIHDWESVSSEQWATIGDLSLTFSRSLFINGKRYQILTDTVPPKAASGVVTSSSPIRFQTYNYGYASTGNVIIVQNGIATEYHEDIDMTISNDAQIFIYFNACLESHTPILMADGTSKAIKDIMLGDKVMSLNPDTMELEEDEVVDCDSGIKKLSYEKDVWNFADGTVLETIHPHQFYNVRLGRMEYIANFNIGDEVLKADGTKTALVSHKVEEGIFFHNTLFTKKFNNYFANNVLSGNRHSKKFGWYWIEQQHN